MNPKHRAIWTWLQQGLIDQDKVDDVLRSELFPSHDNWRKFIEQSLLWLGILALVIAVLFFIAFNWDAMGRFFKFALLELLIVSVLLLHFYYQSNETVYKSSLTAASILLGVLLALFGQTYQTGADPWQLFAVWALLILPWVLLARLPALWIIWLLLINVSMVLYASIFFGLFRFFTSITPLFLLVVFLFNGSAWLVWEALLHRYTWLNQSWPVRLLATLCGFTITLSVLLLIFADGSIFSAILYLAWIGGLVYWYQYRRVDLFMLALVCLCGSTVITALAVRFLFEFDIDVGGFFILSLMVVGLVTGSAVWLRAIQTGSTQDG